MTRLDQTGWAPLVGRAAGGMGVGALMLWVARWLWRTP